MIPRRICQRTGKTKSLKHRWIHFAGTIFTEDMRELESVYEYVIREVHNKAPEGRFRVNTTASTLLTDDPFNLTRECEYFAA